MHTSVTQKKLETFEIHITSKIKYQRSRMGKIKYFDFTPIQFGHQRN